MIKQALCAEALGTLFLVMTVVGSEIIADQLSGGIDGLALIGNTLASGAMLVVGLYISAGHWFTSSTSFVNPAVTLARMLTDTFSGIAPPAVLFFIIVQLLAAWPVSKFLTWLTSSQNTDNQG